MKGALKLDQSFLNFNTLHFYIDYENCYLKVNDNFSHIHYLVNGFSKGLQQLYLKLYILKYQIRIAYFLSELLKIYFAFR
jgi:hypothetical protein